MGGCCSCRCCTTHSLARAHCRESEGRSGCTGRRRRPKGESLNFEAQVNVVAGGVEGKGEARNYGARGMDNFKVLDCLGC